MRVSKEKMKIFRISFIRLIFILIILLTQGTTSAEDKGSWFQGEACVYLGNISWNDAKNDALNRAMNNALEKASGIEIRASQLSLVVENSNVEEITDIFASMIRTQTQGKIIQIKDTTFITNNQPKSPPQICVSGLFKIKFQTNSPDPEFLLDMKINNDMGAVNFKDGENITIDIQSSKDCYLTIFNLYENDSLLILFPNQFLKNSFIPANTSVSIFPDSLQKKGISLKVGLLPGKDTDAEVLLAVATLNKRPFPVFFTKENPYGDFRHFSDALISINKWLLDIPADERTEAMLVYNIYR